MSCHFCARKNTYVIILITFFFVKTDFWEIGRSRKEEFSYYLLVLIGTSFLVNARNNWWYLNFKFDRSLSEHPVYFSYSISALWYSHSLSVSWSLAPSMYTRSCRISFYMQHFGGCLWFLWLDALASSDTMFCEARRAWPLVSFKISSKYSSPFPILSGDCVKASSGCRNYRLRIVL